MPIDRLLEVVDRHVADLESQGTAKGAEVVVSRVLGPKGNEGPRFFLEGEGDRPFIRMNANSYLGMGLNPDVIKAEEETTKAFGAGPGAVRFIAGSYTQHIELEEALARFHGREAGMIFSSAYAAVVGTLTSLIDGNTLVLSDELNHNCIINAMRLARPAGKSIYPHLALDVLEQQLESGKGTARRALVVTDGIFSMRGDHAPVDEIMEIAARHDSGYPENVVVVVDDSHGVGAFGVTGRGTEEHTGSAPSDILLGTLGKAFGVNGGYVVGSARLTRFLRETAAMYIYSNPITPGEASAALKAIEILDSPQGLSLLTHLRALTERFATGLVSLGLEVIPGEHPVVPLMVRETTKTRKLVGQLYEAGVLATGLTYPVVPKGDEEIRFQINADHTEADVDYVLGVLAEAAGA